MDLLQGTLDILMLRALGWGPMHGYAVSRWIRERTDGTLDIEDAALYKALHRLHRAAGLDDKPWTDRLDCPRSRRRPRPHPRTA